MILPDGLKKLETYEEVRAAWGDLFTVAPEDEGGEGEVLFSGNDRVAITVDAVFVKIRKPVKVMPSLELTDVLRISEPTVNDVRQTDRYKGEVEKSICLMSSLCGIPNAEVNKMAASDMALVGNVIAAFLG